MTFVHTPRLPILIWAFWSFPFTIWDTAYIFLRPHTLPGGKWHDPIFVPMDQWASTDRIYGEEGWLNHEGFTAAQGVINMLEVTLYMFYVGIAWRYSKSGLGASFGGKWAVRAVLVGFTGGVVTATKTSLYFMREVFSGYKYTGHNEIHPTFTLWGFMNLLYITLSSYMIISFGRDILMGLSGDSETSTQRKAA